MNRTYGQYCPLARALDRVGDRWTLLIVRDLAPGPKRYSDLLRGLPGVGTTLLAERLKRLEADGIVVRRELPPPAASTVYELSDIGRELASALVPLAAWGVRYLDARGEELMRPEWLIMFWQEFVDPAAARGIHDVYEFHVEGEVFYVAVDDGAVTGGLSRAPREPDVRITTDWRTVMEVAIGRADPLARAGAGEGRIEGDEAAVARFLSLLVDSIPGRQIAARAAGR